MTYSEHELEFTFAKKDACCRRMWTVNQEQQTGIEMMLLHTCSLKEWRSNCFMLATLCETR